MALNYILKFMFSIKSNGPGAMSSSDNATLVSTEAFFCNTCDHSRNNCDEDHFICFTPIQQTCLTCVICPLKNLQHTFLSYVTVQEDGNQTKTSLIVLKKAADFADICITGMSAVCLNSLKNNKTIL